MKRLGYLKGEANVEKRLPLHCLLVERRIVIPAEQTQQEEHRRQKKHYARARANQTGTTRPDIIKMNLPSSALGRSACGGTSASSPASRRTPSNQSTKRLSPDILAESAGEEQPTQTGRGAPEVSRGTQAVELPSNRPGQKS